MENIIVMGKWQIGVVSKISEAQSAATVAVKGRRDGRRQARAGDSTWGSTCKQQPDMDLPPILKTKMNTKSKHLAV